MSQPKLLHFKKRGTLCQKSMQEKKFFGYKKFWVRPLFLSRTLSETPGTNFYVDRGRIFSWPIGGTASASKWFHASYSFKTIPKMTMSTLDNGMYICWKKQLGNITLGLEKGILLMKLLLWIFMFKGRNWDRLGGQGSANLGSNFKKLVKEGSLCPNNGPVQPLQPNYRLTPIILEGSSSGPTLLKNYATYPTCELYLQLWVSSGQGAKFESV